MILPRSPGNPSRSSTIFLASGKNGFHRKAASYIALMTNPFISLLLADTTINPNAHRAGCQAGINRSLQLIQGHRYGLIFVATPLLHKL